MLTTIELGVVIVALVVTGSPVGGERHVEPVPSLRQVLAERPLEIQEVRDRATGPGARLPWRRQSAPTSGSPSADGLCDGARKGAWIGALSGLGTILLLATQCDGGCDDPSLGVMIPAFTGIGAGVGALAGLVADAVR